MEENYSEEVQFSTTCLPLKSFCREKLIAKLKHRIISVCPLYFVLTLLRNRPETFRDGDSYLTFCTFDCLRMIEGGKKVLDAVSELKLYMRKLVVGGGDGGGGDEFVDVKQLVE